MSLTLTQEHAAPTPPYRWRPRVIGQLTLLAVAAYVYAIAEMAPIGAMTSIADDLHVSEARVGMLTAAYALVSVLTTVPLVRWTAHWSRRRVFLLTLTCLTVSQALSAISPGIEFLAASRVLSAVTHGLMWAIIVPIGTRLVPPSYAGRATTAVYVGTSAALIVGNPMTASMSQMWGWRAAVAVIAVAAALITVAARVMLPAMPAEAGQGAAQPSSPTRRPYRNRGLITLCVLTLIGVTAHFASYTFIVPIVRDIVGVHGQREAWVLAGYGIAGLVTMIVLARAIDQRLRAVVASSLVVLCLAFWTLGALAVLGTDVLAAVAGFTAVLLWGASAAALPPMLQSAAIRTCPEEPEQASALYVTSFQVGIMAGSVAGALVYQHASITAVVATSCVLFAVTLVGVVTRSEAFGQPAGASANPE